MKPYSETRSCQIAMALRPRDSPSSMASRYGSQALALVTTAESVITSFSLAGFEVAFAFPFVLTFSSFLFQSESRGSVITRIGRFCRSRVGDHFVGRFCRSPRPQPPGGRTAIPAAFR